MYLGIFLSLPLSYLFVRAFKNILLIKKLRQLIRVFRLHLNKRINAREKPNMSNKQIKTKKQKKKRFHFKSTFVFSSEQELAYV